MTSEYPKMFNFHLRPGNLLPSLGEGPGLDLAGLCGGTKVSSVLSYHSNLGPPTPHNPAADTRRVLYAAQEQSLALRGAEPCLSLSHCAEMFSTAFSLFSTRRNYSTLFYHL